MNLQEYLKKVNELSALKTAMYNTASRLLAKGNKSAARAVYAEIDEVQAELDALENPEDKIATDDELTIRFDNA